MSTKNIEVPNVLMEKSIDNNTVFYFDHSEQLLND